MFKINFCCIYNNRNQKMSVVIYTKPFYKGLKINFDIGIYNKEYLKDVVIGSMNIYDNVEVLIKCRINGKIQTIKLCGPQDKHKMDIQHIEKIYIKYSICDPYTDVNSILNRYSIGKNFSIQHNKNLHSITEEENRKNGFIDFWYNNQINQSSRRSKSDRYYTINGDHVVPHFYETEDDYKTAVKGEHDYVVYDRWTGGNKYLDHGKLAVYNHNKDKFPLINTNNIANCKFDCGRISNTFGRNTCELRCQPNGKAGERMSNNYNRTTSCYDEVSHGYHKNKVPNILPKKKQNLKKYLDDNIIEGFSKNKNSYSSLKNQRQ